MGRWNPGILPALIAVAQICWWPGSELIGGPAVAPASAVVTVIGTLAAAGVLVGRRRRPVIVTLTADGVLIATGLIARLEFSAPDDDLTGLPGQCATLAALFNVGMRRPWRNAVLTCAALTLLDFVSAPPTDIPGAALLPVMMTLYLAVARFGRRRGGWARERHEAEHELAAARQAGSEAATAERRRLARELHDEASHHLIAIVIDASAAEAVGAQRPGLRAQALDRARQTSRDTLAALRKLVDVLPFADLPAPSLTGLADDFRQLGQTVETDLPIAETPRVVAEAAYGIAREALTNTLRYASGGTVRLHLSYDGQKAELVVSDDGRHESTPATAGLGGGNGLIGMRERAQALGGTLQAGPSPDGGWRVHAVLPAPAEPPSPARDVRKPVRDRAALTAVVLVLALTPTLALITHGVMDGLVSGTTAAQLTIVALLHAAPLVWRRRHPWPAFAAATLSLPLGLLLMAAGVFPPEHAAILMSQIPVDLVAAHALAAWGGPPRLTGLGVMVTAVSTSQVLAQLKGFDIKALNKPVDIDLPATFHAVLGLNDNVSMPFCLLLIWLAGHAVWRRRDKRNTSAQGIEAALARAAELTRAERDRFADGLRDAVLQHIADIESAAVRQDLPAVVASARNALAAMRLLLSGAARAGVPTVAATRTAAESTTGKSLHTTWQASAGGH